MFLFTTPTTPSPIPPPTAGASHVVDAIKQGAEATGTDFEYLLRTAKRESALDPSAKAPSTSATGLFQFIEQTWLGVVKSDGGKLGLAAESQAVTARSDGTLTVADPAAREAILKLREEPGVAAAMAGALTRQNRDALQAATGRAPTAGELYMAHVLGARGATDLITTARTDPTRAAATDFPEAARANRGIFYERGGRPRTAAEIYAALTAGQTGVPGQTGASGDTARPASGVPAAQEPPGYHPPGLQGLFQTGTRAGPLSDAVARLWQQNAAGRVPSGREVAFFPRSDAKTASAADDQVSSGDAAVEPPVDTSPESGSASQGAVVQAASVQAASVPLPPVRPSFAPVAAAGSRAAAAGSRRTVASRP